MAGVIALQYIPDYIVGVLYGITSVSVGHPFDTIKTKMQAQSGFEKTNMFETFKKTFRSQGIIGLYRGCIPPLWGSGIFRSVQFAAFEGVYTYLDSPFWKNDIPYTWGLQLKKTTGSTTVPAHVDWRVLAAGAVAATSRAIIECPLEFAKVRRQTQQSWRLREVYTGFGVTWCRCMGLLCTYFILVDTTRRNFPEHFKRPLLGPFLTSGISATLAWWIVWPLEYMKSQVQGNYGQNVSVWQRMKLVVKERGGFLGLYRGISAGTIRSFLANGTSMIVMTLAQKKVSEWGLRG